VAKAFPDISFVGLDYSVNMLASARQHLAKATLANVTFVEGDVVTHEQKASCDLVFSTRCLINLPSDEVQRAALRCIHGMLGPGGTYVMIENFIDGHDAFNHVRRDFGLPEIKVRDHDLFFNDRWFVPFIGDLFDVVAISNISSSYYLVSRVIYSKICANTGVAPDYFDVHHELGSQLPVCGNFGPVKMVVLRKK
jgi:ubiquinone/menaquinone biosynthesis C-methylase UbiE